MHIVRITAMWCMSCLAMKKVWKKVFSDYPELKIVDYDLDFDKDKVEQYNIGKILPVLIVFKDDLEVSRIIGEKSNKELTRLIKELYE